MAEFCYVQSYRDIEQIDHMHVAKQLVGMMQIVSYYKDERSKASSRYLPKARARARSSKSLLIEHLRQLARGSV